MRKFLLGIVFFFGMAGMVSAGSGDLLVRGTNGGVVSWKKALESPVIRIGEETVVVVSADGVEQEYTEPLFLCRNSLSAPEKTEYGIKIANTTGKGQDVEISISFEETDAQGNIFFSPSSFSLAAGESKEGNLLVLGKNFSLGPSRDYAVFVGTLEMTSISGAEERTQNIPVQCSFFDSGTAKSTLEIQSGSQGWRISLENGKEGKIHLPGQPIRTGETLAVSMGIFSRFPQDFREEGNPLSLTESTLLFSDTGWSSRGAVLLPGRPQGFYTESNFSVVPGSVLQEADKSLLVATEHGSCRISYPALIYSENDFFPSEKGKTACGYMGVDDFSFRGIRAVEALECSVPDNSSVEKIPVTENLLVIAETPSLIEIRNGSPFGNIAQISFTPHAGEETTRPVGGEISMVLSRELLWDICSGFVLDLEEMHGEGFSEAEVFGTALERIRPYALLLESFYDLHDFCKEGIYGSVKFSSSGFLESLVISWVQVIFDGDSSGTFLEVTDSGYIRMTDGVPDGKCTLALGIAYTDGSSVAGGKEGPTPTLAPSPTGSLTPTPYDPWITPSPYLTSGPSGSGEETGGCSLGGGYLGCVFVVLPLLLFWR